ncbi:MAG: radical SAM protein [Candidatus Woesearchaeota archaeon]
MKDAYILMLMDCNQDCMFCSLPKKGEYLSYEDLKKKIDRYHKESYDQVTLTGGEPTLHPDLLRTIRYVKSKGMEVRMITNGSNLNKKMIDDIVGAGIDYFALSVHTFDQEKAKKISDYEDYSIKAIFESIEYILNKTAVPLYMNITVTKMNYKELPSMCTYISSNFKKIHMVNFNYVDIFGNVTGKGNVDKIGIEYYRSELYLRKAFGILKKNKINFRVERVPLCYLVGFEEFSSDFNRIMEIEKPKTDFVDKRMSETSPDDFIKAEQCRFCKYSKFCFGMNKNYVRTYGTKEIYPIFHKLPKEKYDRS